jgi:hypothetical protein
MRWSCGASTVDGAAEAAEACAAATRITDAADRLVPELSLYT